MKRIVYGIMMAAVASGLAHSAHAQSTSLTARTQLRRTVEDSDRSAYGDIRLKHSGTRQTVEVRVNRLGELSYGIFLFTNSTSYGTNNLVYDVALLGLKNLKKGTWQRTLSTNGAAPIEIPFFDNLFDVAGSSFTVSRPGADLLLGVTNLFNCVTNISGSATNVNCTTNILFGVPNFDPGSTGEVFSVLWAPVQQLLGRASVSNRNLKAAMTLPPGVPPSPDAKGTIRSRVKNSSGQHILDVKATGLIAGQEYSVWIGDATNATVFIKAGDMTLKRSTARFTRDTKFGDPLPQQVGFITDLTGFPLVILDEFENTHLAGTIP